MLIVTLVEGGGGYTVLEETFGGMEVLQQVDAIYKLALFQELVTSLDHDDAIKTSNRIAN